MSLFLERRPGKRAEFAQEIKPRVEINPQRTSPIAKQDLLQQVPVFTFNRGEIKVVSSQKPKRTDQLTIFSADKGKGGFLDRWSKRFREKPEDATDRNDEPVIIRIPGGGNNNGGEPPIENNGIEEPDWDENDRKAAAIIGPEKVNSIIRISKDLRVFAELASKPDPFKAERPKQTFIDERLKESIAVVDNTTRLFYDIKDESQTLDLRVHAPVLALGGQEIKKYSSVFDEDNSSLIKEQDRIEQIPTSHESPESTNLFTTTVRQTLVRLNLIASTLPSKNIIKEMDEVLHVENVALSMDGYAVGRGMRGVRQIVEEIESIPVEERKKNGSQLAKFRDLRVKIERAGLTDKKIKSAHRSGEAIADDLELSDNLLKKYNEVFKNGSIVYSQLQTIIKIGSTGPTNDLYRVIQSIDADLARITNNRQKPDQLSLDDLEKAAIIEKYLIDKVGFLRSMISQIDLKQKPNTRKTLNKIQQRIYGPAFTRKTTELSKVEEPVIKLPNDFRKATLDSRNIVAGGKRIEAKGAKKFADFLYSIKSDDGEEYFSSDARGLIVSLAAGDFKLDPVLRVMDEFAIGNGEESPLIRALHKQLPERYNDLVDFDRTRLLETVESVQENLRESLTREAITDKMKLIFGNDRIQRVENGLREIKNKLLEKSKNINIKEYEQLDWTILPEGRLKEEAEKIIADAQARSKKPESIEFDLERLTVLEELKSSWEKGNAYYARGTLGHRKVKIKDGSHEPEEYIILVLPYTDASGEPREHAIAESPITRRNAVYMLRRDIVDYDWRDVFSLPKPDAQAFGARPLQHRVRGGETLNESMFKKITGLLECEPQMFHTIRTDSL